MVVMFAGRTEHAARCRPRETLGYGGCCCGTRGKRGRDGALVAHNLLEAMKGVLTNYEMGRPKL